MFSVFFDDIIGKMSGTMNVGETLKPMNPAGMVSNLMSRLYGMEVINWKELVSYDDRNFLVIVRTEHKNPNMDDNIDPNGYLLKVFNSRDSKIPQYFDSLYAMMDFIREKGVPTPKRIPNIDGEFLSKQKIYTDLDDPSCTEFCEYVVVLQTFIPGLTLNKVPLTQPFMYKCGKFVGFIDKSLEDFYHPYYETYETIWSLEAIPKLVDFCYAIEDREKRCVVDEVIDAYKRDVLPSFPEFTKGQIHGDVNLLNMLAKEKPSSPMSDSSEVSTTSTTGSNSSYGLSFTEEKTYNLCGIIDFADATYSYPVFDLALITAYLMIDCNLDDPLEVGGHTLAGYLTEFELNQSEREALPLLVCARLVQSLVMGRYTYLQDTTNEYPLDTEKRGWPLLFKLWEHSMKELHDFWKQIADSYM